MKNTVRLGMVLFRVLKGWRAAGWYAALYNQCNYPDIPCHALPRPIQTTTSVAAAQGNCPSF